MATTSYLVRTSFPGVGDHTWNLLGNLFDVTPVDNISQPATQSIGAGGKKKQFRGVDVDGSEVSMITVFAVDDTVTRNYIKQLIDAGRPTGTITYSKEGSIPQTMRVYLQDNPKYNGKDRSYPDGIKFVYTSA